MSSPTVEDGMHGHYGVVIGAGQVGLSSQSSPVLDSMGRSTRIV
jgi:hypothetical protein